MSAKKALQVDHLSQINSNTDPFEASVLLDQLNRQQISEYPWEEFKDEQVQAAFVIAQGTDCLLLKYYVREPHSKAVYLQSNAPVYKDSCVEFFLGIDSPWEYYNFEFNHAGTGLLCFGTADQRQFLSPALIDQIQYTRSFKKVGSNDLVEWELTLLIPFSVFTFHKITQLSGSSCYANFYKCGDELPIVHYAAWNNISADAPNFHLPEFFGRLDFLHSD